MHQHGTSTQVCPSSGFDRTESCLGPQADRQRPIHWHQHHRNIFSRCLEPAGLKKGMTAHELEQLRLSALVLAHRLPWSGPKMTLHAVSLKALFCVQLPEPAKNTWLITALLQKPRENKSRETSESKDFQFKCGGYLTAVLALAAMTTADRRFNKLKKLRLDTALNSPSSAL